ncbi:MAG: DUF1501 domain-containing protein [Gemmataceae bacterium]|nr:DUF1501 domain-containing protein [Gemmataceae bacterium]
MIHRRDAMLGFGLGALGLPRLLASEAKPRAAAGKAKSCILLFLWGGPPQIDLWDMKPDAPAGIRSHYKPIDTAVPGIRYCDRMPLLAKQAKKIAVVRSVTHPSNEHEVGVYHMLSGKHDSKLRVPINQRKRSDHPAIQGIVSAFTPPGSVPASVTLPRPIGHDGITYTGTHAGWLGPRHDPLELKPAQSSRDDSFALGVPADIGPARLEARRSLLERIDSAEKRMQKLPGTAGLTAFHEQAMRIVASSAVKRALDVSKEPPSVRDRYGRNPYGESFLLCRRLVEAGVRLINFSWVYITAAGRVSNVWDTHGGIDFIPHGKTNYTMLDADYCIPPLDRGLSALLQDLCERGLLDSTLIAAWGEMGRTPKLNGNTGRDHWGAAQTALLAGGGIRGGQHYGATDAHAAFVKDKPVRPEDLLATVYRALGIDPEGEIVDKEGRPHRASEGKPVEALFG